MKLTDSLQSRIVLDYLIKFISLYIILVILKDNFSHYKSKFACVQLFIYLNSLFILNPHHLFLTNILHTITILICLP